MPSGRAGAGGGSEREFQATIGAIRSRRGIGGMGVRSVYQRKNRVFV